MTAADELIERVRVRAADAARQVDVRPNTVAGPGGLLDLGSLMRHATGTGRGQPPHVAELPRPASPEDVARVERATSHRLPTFVKRLYLEVADGGFGPGFGLMSLASVASTYSGLRRDPPGPEGLEWPQALVPLVEEGGGYLCVDASSGAVVAYDGEELLEHWDPDEPDGSAARIGWDACFKTLAPTVESWLEQWLASPTVGERLAARIAGSRDDAMAIHRKNLRETIARYEAVSVEERRKRYPDDVWEALRRQAKEP